MEAWHKGEEEAAWGWGAKIGEYKAFHSVQDAVKYCKNIAEARQDVGDESDFEVVEGYGERDVVAGYQMKRGDDGAWRIIEKYLKKDSKR